MHSPDSQLRRHDAFHSEFLEHDRDVLVWLPPGYDEGLRSRHPVLYMHDGQNLFEPDTAFQKGEHWRLGETAAALIARRQHRAPDHRRHLQHRRASQGGVHADARREAGRRAGRRLWPDDRRGAEAVHRSHVSHAARAAAHRSRRLLAWRARHPVSGLHLPAGVRPARGAVPERVVELARDPEDRAPVARETDLAPVGRHGHRRGQARPRRCPAAQGGAGRAWASPTASICITPNTKARPTASWRGPSVSARC